MLHSLIIQGISILELEAGDNCRATDTINVTVNPIPNPNAGNDTNYL